MTDKTLFQRLVSDSEVEKMLADLRAYSETASEADHPAEIPQQELRLSFDEIDAQHMIEELEELADGEQ